MTFAHVETGSSSGTICSVSSKIIISKTDYSCYLSECFYGIRASHSPGSRFRVHHVFVLFPQLYLIYPDQLGTKKSEQEVVLPLFTLTCFQCAWLSCLWKHHRGNSCCRCILLCRRFEIMISAHKNVFHWFSGISRMASAELRGTKRVHSL